MSCTFDNKWQHHFVHRFFCYWHLISLNLSTFLYLKTGKKKKKDKAASLNLVMKAAMMIVNWDGNNSKFSNFHGGNWQVCVEVMIIQQKENRAIWHSLQMSAGILGLCYCFSIQTLLEFF